MIATSIGALLVSIMALIVALTTLWRSQFAKCRFVCVAGPMEFSIMKMQEQGGDSWLIPNLSATLSITNEGAKSGRVLGFRAVIYYPNHPTAGANEALACHGEFDSTQHLKSPAGAAKMREAIISHSVQFTVLSKSTVEKFLVFSGRWDNPVRQNRLEICVEMLTDQDSEWSEVWRWQFDHLTANLWQYMEDGSANALAYPDSRLNAAVSTYPDSLHDHTCDPKMLNQDVPPVPVVREISRDTNGISAE